MKRFEREVTSAFTGLLQLRWAAAYSHGEFVPLVAPLFHGCLLYLFARDQRSGDGPVRVDVWVAPPHPPDDGLDNLMLGFQIRIAESFEIEDDFLSRCARRAKCLEPSLEGLAAAVENELAVPSFDTLRFRSYMFERELFKLVCGRTSDELATVGQDPPRRVAKKVVGGTAPFSALEASCQHACELLEARQRLSDDLLSFYDADSRWMGEAVAGHAYVNALAG
jgi:hypothetical protein